jgi:hypothetical protein
MLRYAVGSLLVAAALFAPAAADSPAPRDDGLRVVAQAIVAGQGDATPAPKPACTDTAYALAGWKHTTTFTWSYNPAGAPSNIASAAQATFQQGTNTVFTGQNRCGIAPQLAMSQAYQSTTSKAPEVSADGTCTGNDGVSVAGWGELPAPTIALTCTYYESTGAVVASDVLVDNSQHPYYTTAGTGAKPANCANMWDLLAVVVHERGHTAGLAHVDQDAHAVASMSPRTLACDSSETTLAAGDVAGLQSLYQS